MFEIIALSFSGLLGGYFFNAKIMIAISKSVTIVAYSIASPPNIKSEGIALRYVKG